jgi:general secretion pathway protein G
MKKRNAFTLIEVLIVVIIMAILAATIIPQFTTSTTDAKKSSLKFNVHTIRSLIELYKAHHNGSMPTLTNFATQMTSKTDIDGNTSGTNLLYGPYLVGKLPTNPYNNLSTVVTVSSAGTTPTTGSGASGWQYDESTGGFYPNNTEWTGD